MLSAEELRVTIFYEPESGQLFWLKGPRSGQRVGDPNCISKDRYLRIWISGKCYLAHRLAWFYMTGEWPPYQVDHENLDKSDNRWKNLRPASHAQNNANHRVRKDSKTGLKGVWKAKNRWQAQITVNGEKIHLGTFDAKEEAAEAYRVAAEMYFGEFARAA